MDMLHIALMIAGAVVGWLVKHYQTPDTHKAVNELLDKAKKKKAEAELHDLLGVQPKPADKPAA